MDTNEKAVLALSPFWLWENWMPPPISSPPPCSFKVPSFWSAAWTRSWAHICISKWAQVHKVNTAHNLSACMEAEFGRRGKGGGGRIRWTGWILWLKLRCNNCPLYSCTWPMRAMYSLGSTLPLRLGMFSFLGSLPCCPLLSANWSHHAFFWPRLAH